MLVPFQGLGPAAVFTFWFLPSSGSSGVGPTAGRRQGTAGVTSALCCADVLHFHL